jgi:hypothetical protein
MGEHRRSLAIGEEYAKRLLRLTKNANVDKIVEKLVWQYPSHSFAIDYDEAKELKLPVERLDAADENNLLEILTELQDYEIAIHGFLTRRTSKPARAAKPAGRTPTSRKKPKSVPPKLPGQAAVA